ncbi:MAG TPA: TetR family transcriptional regulator [Casimicrobiaceae bacterium]|nr:TetR family transcriptional regulator [Casimicrobiaceae bacterium]
MPRPSRNVDAALLAAGRALYPAVGMRALSVRRVAEHAGVNLGMFHYHFGSKEQFIRTLLTQLYDGMFAELALAAANDARPVEALRAAAIVIARFVRDHRLLLRRLMADAMNGETLAVEFAAANLPRHFGVILGLVHAGQRAGALKPVPPAQAVAFIAGAVGGPIIIGGAIVERDGMPAALRRTFETAVVSDQALAERVDLVLAGLCVARPARKTTR